MSTQFKDISQANHQISASLSTLLADTFAIYLKNQKFHWNVTGHLFPVLHGLFQVQYTELALAADQIAERIRAKGSFAPGSFSEFLKLTTIKDSIFEMSARNMLEDLYQDNLKVIKTATDLLNILRECSDPVTTDLVVRRIEVHEKNIWMIGSMLET
jgi:starvation-inducible DNA-binding protein